MKAINPCVLCHRKVGTINGAILLEAPDRMKEHVESLILQWHIKCFEKQFGVKLSTFKKVK